MTLSWSVGNPRSRLIFETPTFNFFKVEDIKKNTVVTINSSLKYKPKRIENIGPHKTHMNNNSSITLKSQKVKPPEFPSTDNQI